jgi:hypothetical protein
VLFNTIAGSGHSTPRSHQPSGAGAALGAAEAADGQGNRIQEISEVLKEGPDSKHTLETMKSMDRTLNRSLTNVSACVHSVLFCYMLPVTLVFCILSTVHCVTSALLILA